MKNKLTQRQYQILGIIEKYQAEHNGESPTDKEIGDISGITSQGAGYEIRTLIRNNYITRKMQRNTITITNKKWKTEVPKRKRAERSKIAYRKEKCKK